MKESWCLISVVDGIESVVRRYGSYTLADFDKEKLEAVFPDGEYTVRFC